MEKCIIKALADGYSANIPLNDKSVSIGSKINIIQSIGSKSITVNVTWKVSRCNYLYMIMFYLGYENTAFEIDLITNGVLETKVCKFLPDTFSASLDDNIWTINAILEVIK